MVCNDIGLAWPLGTRVTTAVVKGNPFCPQGQLEFSIVSLNSSAPVLELVATDGYMNGARFPLQFYLSPYALGKVIRSRGRKASIAQPERWRASISPNPATSASRKSISE